MEKILNLLRQLLSFGKFKTAIQSTMLIQRLTRIIGPILPHQEIRINQLSPLQLEALAQAADNFSTPDDLEQWLNSQA